MPELLPAFHHMLAAWNEGNPDRVRGHLERALTPDVHFVDPSIETRGLDEFEANVHGFRKRLPDAVCSHSSGVDAHHNLYRYHWEIHRGSELFLPGFDVVEVTPDERIARVLGFFGPVPPHAAV